MTEFDCGPTALMNAIQYLYEGDEIPPEFPKKIWDITMDGFNADGMPCRSGTTKEAMRYMGSWFNQFAEKTGFPIRTTFLERDEVNVEKLSALFSCQDACPLRVQSAVVVRCVLEVEHYITLAGVDGDNIEVWDPYWEESEEQTDGVVVIEDHPKEYNRLIRKNLMDTEDGKVYSFGKIERRDALVLTRSGETVQKYQSFC